jgi:hypothetical protein
MAGELVPIQIQAGVESSLDKPEATTQHYTFADKIRFVGGYPEKIGGWEALDLLGEDALTGVARSIFSYTQNGYNRYLIGTNTTLFDLVAQDLTNITPLKTSSVAAANSLATYRATLGNNPIATTNGSVTLIITDTAHKFKEGDTVTLSGASTTNGVPNTEINAAHYVRAVTTNTYTIIVSTAASSTGSGGGASVVRSSGIITVTKAAHGLSNGYRVGISGAVATGGITAPQINVESIIRGVTTNTFDILTAGTATSTVAGGGGASTVYFPQIDGGFADTITGAGYGLGLYGVGLYGVSKLASNQTPARLWSHARFGDLTLSAYNNQSSIYQWDAELSVAPVKVTNSPPCNYVFVSNEIVVALGYDKALALPNENGISWSDQGGLTNWTTGQAGSDTIEGAGLFLSHLNVRGTNLLFTNTQTYTFRYIGGQFIWETLLLEAGIGIIAQNARVTASGVGYFMGTDNFYMWRGANIEVIPSNTDEQSTILRYVFDDLNYSQAAKIFAWYNAKFREIQFHYPSALSSECDRIARYNIDTQVWVMDTIDRTAAEYPSVLTETPVLIGQDNEIYLHESGLNDNGAGMEWQLTTNKVFGGTDTVQISAFIPDMQGLTGDFNVNVLTQDYPLGDTRSDTNYTVPDASGRGRNAVEKNGRFVQFDMTGNDLDQRVAFGQWYMEVKKGSPK